MALPAVEYWRDRFEQLETALLHQGMAYYDDVEKQYTLAMQTIQKDLTLWYTRLAANNAISYAEAKQLLTKDQLKEFHWTVFEYIRHGKENHLNPQWTKQLENASAKVHITRLEAMQLQLQQSLEALYGNQLDGLDHTMRRLYSDGYYRSAFELQKGIGVGSKLQQLNDRQVEQVVSKPWAVDGKNFSDRVWENKEKLVNTLHTELTQATIRGDGLDRAVKAIAKQMNTAESAAGRLVMTESAFFASAGQKDCFTDLGVKQYEIVATLDRKTSKICRRLDGKVFDMKDFKPGVTAPPFHCWCRTCTAPYFGDEEGRSGKRAARTGKGKTYYVPGNMTYSEWEKQFVQ